MQEMNDLALRFGCLGPIWTVCNGARSGGFGFGVVHNPELALRGKTILENTNGCFPKLGYLVGGRMMIVEFCGLHWAPLFWETPNCFSDIL